MSTFIVPNPDPADSSAVSEGLLTASAELARGEHREALRLLRAAAEAAEEAGNDLRSLALARAAADLANELGGSRPPSAALPASVAFPAPAAPAPPPPSVAPAPPAPPPPSVAPAPPAPLPPSVAPVPPAPPPPSVAPAPPPPPASVAPAHPTSQVMLAAPASAALPPDLAALVESGRAVRVLVKRSTRDEELYVVRRPTDGKALLDAREALIILVEPDSAFFTKA